MKEVALLAILSAPVVVAMAWGELSLHLRTRHGPGAQWTGAFLLALIATAMFAATDAEVGAPAVTLRTRLLIGGIAGVASVSVVTLVSQFLQDEPEFRIRRRTLRLITVGVAAAGMCFLSFIFMFFVYNW